MGWRGASANSLLALIGAYYFMGGMALYVAGILEFIIGNTFPALVFTSFGTFGLRSEDSLTRAMRFRRPC